MDVDRAFGQLFFATVFLQGEGIAASSGTRASWSGTGFLYEVPTNEDAVVFLVTNRHVFDGPPGVEAERLHVRVIATGANLEPDLGTPCAGTVDREPGDAYGHPIETVDVAVMPFHPVLEELNRQSGKGAYVRMIHDEFALSESDLEDEATALEDVVFVGYPNGIYDTANLTPVARRGITATPIALDYRGDPAYLIDASVFEGSSGSPVFIYRGPGDGMSARSEGSAPRRLVFGGVLASVHSRLRVGEVVELPTRYAAVTQEHLGLGIVYKPWTVATCIDIALADHGLQRAEDAPEDLVGEVG